MFSLKINPRFNDTDALGHVNNTVVAEWYEDARRPIFELFNPTLDIKKWNLIIARIEIDYLKQIEYVDKIEIQTEFNKLGRSSMGIVQNIIVEGEIKAKGLCTMVYFDYEKNKSAEIPQEIRVELERHILKN